MKLEFTSLPMNRPAIRQRAFSLLEVMVAVGLLAFIIVGLVLTFNQVQRAFRVGLGQSDVLEGGRAVMNVLVRDLQEVSAFGDDYVTNFFSYRAYPETYQDQPGGGQRTNRLCDFYFISRRNDEYAILAYRVDATNELIGSLMRFETNILQNNVVDTYLAASNIMANDIGRWLYREVPSSRFHPVADNVVHFQAVANDTNGHAFAFTNNYRTNYTDRFDGAANDVFQFSGKDLPAYVDLELGVMEPSTAAKLKIRADANPQQGEDYFKDRIGKVDLFRQRIPIRAAATQIKPPN